MTTREPFACSACAKCAAEDGACPWCGHTPLLDLRDADQRRVLEREEQRHRRRQTARFMSVGAIVALIVGVALLIGYGTWFGFPRDEVTGRPMPGGFWVVGFIAFGVGLATYGALERTLGKRQRFPHLQKWQ